MIQFKTKAEWLRDLARELKTQDNRATAHPLYQVQQRYMICGIDPDWSDEGERYWYHRDSDGPVPRAHAVREIAEHLECDPETIDDAALDIEGYRQVGVLFEYRFVSAHFTESAAQTFIDQNSHNLTEPRIYVSSQYRCYEWIAVVEHLKEST